jgi:hypothetical protein
MLALWRARVTSSRVSAAEASTVLGPLHGAAPEHSAVSFLQDPGPASNRALKARVHGRVCSVALAKSHAPETGFCPTVEPPKRTSSHLLARVDQPRAFGKINKARDRDQSTSAVVVDGQSNICIAVSPMRRRIARLASPPSFLLRPNSLP